MHKFLNDILFAPPFEGQMLAIEVGRELGRTPFKFTKVLARANSTLLFFDKGDELISSVLGIMTEKFSQGVQVDIQGSELSHLNWFS